MARTYFEGWFSGCYVKAEDWYTDNLVYVNVRCYWKSTAVSRPDKEKSFLLKLDDPNRISAYSHSIASCLLALEESRDSEGRLLPIRLTPPSICLG